jgi:hypothetical protein
MAVAEIFSWFSCSATLSAPRLVRVNTIARVIDASFSRLASSARLPEASTKCTLCSTSTGVDATA